MSHMVKCKVFIIYLFLTTFLFAGIQNIKIEVRNDVGMLKEDSEGNLVLDLGYFSAGQKFEGKVATVGVKISQRKERDDEDECMLDGIADEVNVKRLTTQNFDMQGVGFNYIKDGYSNLKVRPSKIRVLKVDSFPGALENPQGQVLVDRECTYEDWGPIYELWFEFDVIVELDVGEEKNSLDARIILPTYGDGWLYSYKMLDMVKNILRLSISGPRRR